MSFLCGHVLHQTTANTLALSGLKCPTELQLWDFCALIKIDAEEFYNRITNV
jgi:hypothetical protein